MSSSTFLVEVSARHVHLSTKEAEALFGAGASLTPARALSQPGQYLCNERVDVVGPKGSFKHVAVLGPERPEPQVEVSLTDCITLGVAAPVRESGDIAGTPGITLIGPSGSLTLERGLIVAMRHIHISPEDARSRVLSDGDIVSVAVDAPLRPLVFGGVLVRVSPDNNLVMHIDTDEANAACVPKAGAQGHITKNA